MQQTLLGLLALMIVGSFTLNQHRDVNRTYSELVDDELEIAASGVAMHIMELIGNRSFDSRTRPDAISDAGYPVGSEEMTSSSAFGKYSGCDLDEPFKDAIQCTDVDDAHMGPDEWQAVPFRLKDGDELKFDVNVEVFYIGADDMNTPLLPGYRSMHKKVIVRIRSQHHLSQNRYEAGFVRLERIFSYDKKRAENRYQEKYGTTTIPVPPPPQDPPPVDNPPPVDQGAGSVEPDPDSIVTICHRSVKRGQIRWTTKNVRYKFLQKHIQHGDLLGACQL